METALLGTVDDGVWFGGGLMDRMPMLYWTIIIMFRTSLIKTRMFSPHSRMSQFSNRDVDI